MKQSQEGGWEAAVNMSTCTSGTHTVRSQKGGKKGSCRRAGSTQAGSLKWKGAMRTDRWVGREEDAHSVSIVGTTATCGGNCSR